MMFRLTQKLNARIKAGPLPALPAHDRPLLDWSAHLLTVARTRYILLTNTASLYSALLLGKGITDSSDFIDRAIGTLRDFLTDHGHGAAFAHCIAPASATVRFAKALNRSVTGSMNELAKFASYSLAAGDTSIFDVATQLNDILLSALGDGASTHGFPRDAFAEMVRTAMAQVSG